MFSNIKCQRSFRYYCHQDVFSLHLFAASFFFIPSLYLPCSVFWLIYHWFYFITLIGKYVMPKPPVVWKYVISFKIKKQNIFNASLIIKGCVYLISFVCLSFGVFREG